ncbi:MAG: phosphoenolpyruvate--protein phosphotransferase, partial [Gemmataceae bacterium]
MEIKRGIPVSPGVAIGPALMLDAEFFRIPRRVIDAGETPAEGERLRKALAAAATEAREKEQAVNEQIGPQIGAIFSAHANMIEDPILASEIEELIRTQRFTAEYAVSSVMRQYVKKFESIDRRMTASRIADLLDIEKRVLRNLLGQRREQLQHLKEPVIVLAHDLTPSETATLDTNKVYAFATEAGGRASHTAIIAGALEIPAVVGLGRFVTDVSGGDLVIVDGNHGVLILNPDAETLERYKQQQTTFRSFESRLEELRDLPAETRDGARIQLLGNIEFPHETDHCLERGADGVGLYRTEFLYLGRQSDPTEEDHLEAYLQVVQSMGNRPVVIRTLDLGADKFATEHQEERNPFLGLRSVRLCLQNLTLFKTQLRAILRASASGDVRIMFPMVSTIL